MKNCSTLTIFLGLPTVELTINIIVMSGRKARSEEEVLAFTKDLLAEEKSTEQVMQTYNGWAGVYDQLKGYGFTDIDALDGSAKMLEGAKSKNVYKNLIQSIISSEPMDIEKGTYDTVVCMGAFVANHLSAQCFNELIRITKPGGYCVFGIWKKDMHVYGPEMDRLVAEKKWVIEEKITEVISGTDEVHLYILQTSD